MLVAALLADFLITGWGVKFQVVFASFLTFLYRFKNILRNKMSITSKIVSWEAPMIAKGILIHP